jgi:prophage regulatory protein
MPCGDSGLAPCCVVLITARRSMQASLGSDSENRILRSPKVILLFPVSRSAWYKGVAEGRYPAGIKVSARAVGWKKSDIDKLMTSLSSARDDAIE